MNKSFILILFAAALISGCSKEKPRTDYVARVNDSYLTAEEFSKMTASGSNAKEEIIRNWIRREILYQQAMKDGIPDDKEFQKLIDNSKKELAAATILQKYFEDESIVYEPKDLEDYFSENKNKFRLFYDSYLLNLVTFDDEDKAVRFRITAIESDWNKALNVFNNDLSIIHERTKNLFYEQDIHPSLLLRMVKELYPNEISIVLPDDPGRYTVVQLVEIFEKGTIPPYEIIKDRVENMFIAEKKELALKNYLQDLYSDNEIEIKIPIGNK